MKTSTWVAWASSVAVAACVIASLGLLYYQDELTLKLLTPALLSLLGTFVGAVLGFRLGQYKDDVKAATDKKEALNRALFVLACQRNDVVELHKELLKHKTEFELSFNMPAIKLPDHSKLFIDIPSISFLLRTAEPSILLSAYLSQTAFQQTHAALQIRNEHYLKEVAPKIAALNLNKTYVTPDDLRKALGTHAYEGSVSMARNFATLAIECDEELERTFKALRRAAKAEFPKDSFMDLQMNAPRPVVPAARG